jgi:acyl dehydratase/NADP-dependent 3-hydroxy acid dehydrogenase YdfG
MEDQRNFAAFCGDGNPIHMEALSARRTQAGAPVVHGIHVLLWTLETLLGSGTLAAAPRSLRVRFRAPVLVGSDVRLETHKKNDGTVSAKVRMGEASCCSVEAADRTSLTAPMRVPLSDASVPAATIPQSPLERVFDAASLPSGRFRLFEPRAEILWPLTEAAFGRPSLQAMGFISTLVGMVYPGLYSLLGSVDIDFDGPDTAWMDFRVVETDDRFQRTVIEIAGAGVKARVEAFFRAPPIAQPHISALAPHMQPREFGGSVALVVGGSRGLGALTAKILAAGGARVLLTYAVGAEEAAEVQKEIREAGGACEILKFDALQDAFAVPAGHPAPTHAYYFATPKIFLSRRTKAFSREVLDYFTAFYVDGMEKLVRTLAEAHPDPIRVFNPSSVAITERTPNMAEYVMAKAAAEILGEYLVRSYGNVSVVSHRLPRLLTDQTVTVSPVQTAPAEDVMLPLIRQFQSTA